MPSILSFSNVELGYGRARVLRVDSLDIREAEAWFVLGPNGSGKSTLLRAIMGLLDPMSGRIERDADIMKPERIGFVPQSCESRALLPTTLREFVALGLVGLRVPRADRARRIYQALDRVGLSPLALTDFWTLSGGQRQRALLARALVREPVLLVLDEPTNGLDPAAEESLLRILEERRRESDLTMVFVTHDVSLAARHASHIALLHGGRLLSGARAEMLTERNLVALFGVDPLGGVR